VQFDFNKLQKKVQSKSGVWHSIFPNQNPMTSMTPYQPFPNSFKRRLLAGEKLIGCWSSLSNAITTEILGLAGFDWILLDGEHSPNDVATFIPQLMALKDSPSAPVVRPSSNNVVEIKRLLDAGFYNFLIPFVESVEEASRAVSSTRYPPQGIRGVSVAQRSNRYGTLPDYFKGINEQICVMVQIESRAGMAATRAIAALDGVDSIFVGPSDLAAALGIWATRPIRKCRRQLHRCLPMPKPAASPPAFWRQSKPRRVATSKWAQPLSASAAIWAAFAAPCRACASAIASDLTNRLLTNHWRLP
jgi:2-dehydro-3-deoxyglucarate aldolase